MERERFLSQEQPTCLPVGIPRGGSRWLLHVAAEPGQRSSKRLKRDCASLLSRANAAHRDNLLGLTLGLAT